MICVCVCVCIYIYIYIYTITATSKHRQRSTQSMVCSDGANHASSVNVRLPRLQKDLRTVSISRDIENFPCELCRRGSGMFTRKSHVWCRLVCDEGGARSEYVLHMRCASRSVIARECVMRMSEHWSKPRSEPRCGGIAVATQNWYCRSCNLTEICFCEVLCLSDPPFADEEFPVCGQGPGAPVRGKVQSTVVEWFARIMQREHTNIMQT